jgi:hypothetical protein
MRVFKNNEELKSLIVEGNITINDDIKCDFDINVEANIKANNIDACDIKAHNIDACDIDAHDIDAHNIDAYDIDACDIDACDINYYAFCIAYKSLICESITGRRSNSLHNCLDGEITIKEKLKELVVNNITFNLNKEQINSIKRQLK